MSAKVPSRLLRYNALGFESFATYKSTHPSSSKSSVLTPRPYVPDARVMPDGIGHVGETAIAGIPVQHVLAASQSWGTARDRNTLVTAQARFRNRCGLEIEVDVICREEIQSAVAVIVEKRAPSAPARAHRVDAGAPGRLFESAVATIAEQAVLSPEGHEQVLVAVVVVVTRTGRLAPPAQRHPCFVRDIFEGTVATVAVEMARRLLAFRKALERGTIDDEQVQPAVVVVVEGGGAGAGSFEEIAVGLSTAVRGHRSETRARRNLGECEIERIGEALTASGINEIDSKRRGDQSGRSHCSAGPGLHCVFSAAVGRFPNFRASAR